jgi:serine/threonine protein kinase
LGIAKLHGAAITVRHHTRIVLYLPRKESKANTSNIDYLGTIRYLAPEVMRVKHCNSTSFFSCSVDVWALGITLLELIISRRITSELGREENRAELNNYLRQTQGSDDSEMSLFGGLAERMVVWEASRRISAERVKKWLEERFPERGGGEEDLELTPTKRRKHR